MMRFVVVWPVEGGGQFSGNHVRRSACHPLPCCHAAWVLTLGIHPHLPPTSHPPASQGDVELRQKANSDPRPFAPVKLAAN